MRMQTTNPAPKAARGRSRQSMAALSTIPCYELAALSSREVLVVGTGELAAEVARGLALLEVGMVSLVDPQRTTFSPEEETIWKAFLETQAPGTVVRHLPRGLEVLVQGLEVPSGADLVVTCDIDGRLRAVVRRALGRCLVPWIEIGTYGSVCSLTTYLPGPADPGSAPHGLVRYGGASQEPGLAASAVLGGLSALEAARVLLRASGYPTLAGQVCLVDARTLSSQILEIA